MNFDESSKEEQVRHDFAGTCKKTYLNSAAISLMPLQSIEAIKDFLVLYNVSGPNSDESEELVIHLLKEVREEVAGIISCQPDEVVLTQSTTDGVNIVANGLPFKRNSNVIIRGMTHEHHANLYPWLRLSEKKGVNIKTLKINTNDGCFDMSDFRSCVDSNTKLVTFSHALYNTGTILPVKQIGDAVTDTEAMYFLDSAQTVGCIEEDACNVSDIGCDFMSFNGSKWLCGPLGTGLFYCNKEVADRVEPVMVGGESAVISDSDSTIKNGKSIKNHKITFMDMPDRFQTGFRNYAGMAGLLSSIKYLKKFGIDNIRKKNRYLSTLFCEELSRISRVTIYGSDNPKDRTSIVSFNIDGVSSEKVTSILESKYKIVLAEREIMQQKIVRASPHFYNTEQQILHTISAIKDIRDSLAHR